MPLKPVEIGEYHVFIACPSDMNAERQAVRDFFDRLNRHIARNWGVRFEIVDWENYSTVGIGRPQELITQQTMDRFSNSLALVIGLMGQRFGTPTGTAESGTEEEFDLALNHWRKTGWPEIKFFFRKIDKFEAPADPTEIAKALEQWQKVLKFKERLQIGATQNFFKEYPNLDSFPNIFSEDLLSWLSNERRPWRKSDSSTVEAFQKAQQVLAFNILNYRKALNVHYSRLNMDCFDTFREGDRVLRLWDVFIPQNVRECETLMRKALETPANIRRNQHRHRIPTNARTEVQKANQDELSRRYFNSSPRSVLKMLTDPYNERIVILGDPGAGKSSLLQWLALSGSAASNNQLALLVQLKEYHRWTPEGGGPKTLLRFCAESHSFPYSVPQETSAEFLAKPYGAAVLLDGLDEIFDFQVRNDIIKEIIALGINCPNAQIILTSRVYGFDDSLFKEAGFRVYMLQDFESEQIKEFLDRWHEHAFAEERESKSKRERIHLSLETNDRIRELAGNPLLLTMMAILNRRQELPRDRAELYEQCTRVLLDLWQTEGRKLVDAFPELKSNGIDVRDKRAILRCVAWRMQTDSKSSNLISEEDLEATLETYLGKERYLPNPLTLAKALIRELREINFTLCFLGVGLYAFVHRTFLEYFCASEIVDRFQKRRTLSQKNLLQEIFGKHWNEETWHETLCLVAGMIDESVVADIIGFLLSQPDASNKECRQVFLAARLCQEARNRAPLKNHQAALIKALDKVAHREINYDDYSGDYRIKESAIRAITWTLGILPSTKQHLLNYVKHDKDGVVRRTAVQELARGWKNKSELRWLKRRVNHDAHMDVRQAAIQELARCWKDDFQTKSWLMECAQNGDHIDVRQAAVEEMARVWKEYPETLPWLKKYAQNDRDWNVRQAAVRELAHGWRDYPATLSLLADCAQSDDSPFVRRTAVKELARGWRDDSRMLPWLKDHARKAKFPDVRQAAIQELARGWKNDPETLPLIKKRAQKDKNQDVRQTALDELALGWKDNPETQSYLHQRAQENNAKGVPANPMTHTPDMDIPLSTLLDQVYNHADKDVRRHAIQQLAGRWRSNSKTFGILMDRVRDDYDEWVRRTAVCELARGWEDESDMPHILMERARIDESGWVRQMAVEELARGWKKAPETLFWLKERAQSDKHSDVRKQAIQELARGWKSDPETLLILKKCAQCDRDPIVRQAAIRELTLGGKSNPEIFSILKERAQLDSDSEVRKDAIEEIAQRWRNNPDTLIILKERAQSDDDWFVRQEAVEKLKRGWKSDSDVQSFVQEIEEASRKKLSQ